MPNIVRHKEFKKVVDALWSKIKTNFITDITYNPVDRTLNKTKNNLNEEITKVVTEWKDLDYTTQSSIKNIFDKNTQVTEDQNYFVNHGIIKDQNWRMATIPCNSGESFTIVKMSNHDSGHIAFLDEHNRILEGVNVSSYATVGGKTVYRFTVPSHLSNVAYFTVNIHKQTVSPDRVMVFSGHIDNNDIPTNYVPFADGATVLIYSNEVALSFDGAGTDLSSATIHSAIKEINNKIANTGTVKSVNGVHPQQDGSVTVNAGHIGYNGNTSNILATNVQQAIDMLKQDVDVLPTASIYIVPDKQELDDLLTLNVLNHGDLIYVINSNGVLDYQGQPANGGNPVAMIYDTSLSDTTNRLRVFSKFGTGAININASTVAYDDNITQLQVQNVQGAIEKLNEKVENVSGGTVTRVNGVAPVGGNVTITASNIDGSFKGYPDKKLDVHLDEFDTRIIQNLNKILSLELQDNNHTRLINDLTNVNNTQNNRIQALENRRTNQYRVGDVITTFKQSDSNYSIGNVEFIYLGKQNNTVSAALYPDLASAFGIQSSTANFTLPQIPDIERVFDVVKRTRQKHFIVAKIN